MPVSDLEKCRSKRKVAKSNATKNSNRIRELIAEKGSESKIRQFAKNLEEAWDRARELTRELEDLDPQSIETDGKWLEDLEVDKTKILGEVSDYLNANKPESGAINCVSPPAQSGEKIKSGLKGVQVPTFDGSRDKWPYFWGIFSSLVHNNKNLSEAVKLAHLNNSLTDNVKGDILCLTGGPGDYEKAIKLLSDRYGDPRDVVEAQLHRIIDWPNIKSNDREGFQAFADALQAAVFALDKPSFTHELKSVPLCLQLVRKLPSKEKDEWVRQVEREQFPENVKGLAEWAQVRAKTLRVRERYNEQTVFYV